MECAFLTVAVAHAEAHAPGENQWHLFNDFLVCPTTPEEALRFNNSWKTPSVVCFQVKSANNQIHHGWKDTMDTSILYYDPRFVQAYYSLILADLRASPGQPSKTYQVLDPEAELPGPETIVAIDAEFVSVRQPEIEMNSDGVRETIRPIVYALARASVVRGQGEHEGLPFIDDYIAIKEPIVDYLTSYSGITYGDLDARTSANTIVPLKVAYKKLWILLNLGCKFLGHGLRQDFRVINIHIPKSQVIDTSDLFIIKRHLRKLSLAFLAWHLLKENIQLETHDSIEDARTALKLYRKYQEFSDAGVLEQILLDIYRVGREVNFRPPRAGDVEMPRAETPPLQDRGGAAAVAGPLTPSRGGGTAGSAPGGGFGGAASWTPGKGRA